MLHAKGGIFGTFNHVTLPALPAGLAWNLNYTDVAVLLQVTGAGLLGDYNGNGVVDAADYTLWRDNLGAPTEASINNNGDGGGVTASDYTYWKTRFGNTSGAGAGSVSAAVPEPASFVLLMMAAAGWCIWRRRSA